MSELGRFNASLYPKLEHSQLVHYPARGVEECFEVLICEACVEALCSRALRQEYDAWFSRVVTEVQAEKCFATVAIEDEQSINVFDEIAPRQALVAELNLI